VNPPSRNILILLFGSERDFATLRPGDSVRGFYQSGPERDYIAILAGSDINRILLHEYTHSVLNHAAAPLPQWFEEGLAELYSTLVVNGARASVGGPIPEHVSALRRERWLTGSELAAVGKDSPHYNDTGKIDMFYAQAWALTHMLTFAQGYRERLPDFVDLITRGAESEAAFKEAFGKEVDAAVNDLRAYARAGFPSVAIDAPGAGDIVFSAPERLESAVVLQSRAEILLLMGREQEARRIYEQVAKRYPKSPAAQTGLAVLAVRNRDYAAARKLFENAIALGASDASTYFEYAMLLRDTGAPPDRVNEFLDKTIQANPGHAEAHFLLGIRASDAGRFSDAVVHLRAATDILPRQAYFWQALAFANHKLGRAGEARDAALRALRAAGTDHEEQMARSALNLIEAREPASTKPRPAVNTPESWNPPVGDASISADLVRVDCEGGSARLHLRRDGDTTVLVVSDPRTVTIQGGPARRTIPCGVQSPTPVKVDFIAATKQVTAIEFH
jgi:tetratricopeptide (TPR) repeat protein